MPDVFLIPSAVWEESNGVFVDRKYEKAGQKSQPEWGIDMSNKNYYILEMFDFKDSIKEFMWSGSEMGEFL